MMDDFFGSGEEELEDIEGDELISRYENMIRNNHSIYFSLDDYENLFMYYTRFYDDSYSLEDINLEMARLVIQDGIVQYPNASLLQLFYIYYRYLNNELLINETVDQLKGISFQEYEKVSLTYHLINIYIKINLTAEAISLYKQLLKLAQTDEEKINIYSELIFLFNRPEDVPKIVGYCEKLMELEPKREKSLLRELYVHFLFKNDLGLSFFELYVENHPFSINGWQYLGETYSGLSLYEKAVSALDNAVALSDKADPLISLGGIYSAWGQREKALECYNEALSISPERTDFYVDIAELYYAVGQIEVALRYYGLALDVNPDDISALMGMAIALAAIEKYDEAIAYLQKVQRSDFASIEALLLLSDYLIEVERDEEAIQLFQQMIESYPLVVDVWLSYSNYYAIIENYRQACAILNQGLVVLQDNVQLIYRMANYYFLYGDYEQATSYLRIAYMIDKTYLDMFLDYDEQTAKLPEVIETIKELTHKD